MRSTERPEVRYRKICPGRYEVFDRHSDELLGTVMQNPIAILEMRWDAYTPDWKWLGATDVRYDAAQSLVTNAD